MNDWDRNLQNYQHKNLDTIQSLLLNVRSKKIRYKKFPYLDTFKYYNVKAGELSNFDIESGFSLISTSGDYLNNNSNIIRGLVDTGRNWIRRYDEYNSENLNNI